MRLPIPVSFGFLVFAGIAYLLQLTPIIGVFLMILAAPYWSVILVNLGFLGIALEAGFGTTRRFWMILPILWFGGYAGWAATDRIILATETSKLRQINAANAVMVGASGPVIIDNDRYYDGQAMAVTLASRYAVSPVYVTTTGLRKVRATTAYRFSRGGLCAGSIGDDGPQISRHALPGSRGRRNGCVYSLQEDPPAQTVRISITHHPDPGSGLLASRTEMRMAGTSGSDMVFQTATGAPLPWIPRPILGCALNSGLSEWQCFHQFDRERSRDLLTGQFGNEGLEDAIAAALGLAPRTARTQDDPASEARTAELTAAAISRDLANLEAMLADPETTEHGYVNLAMLKTAPDLLHPHIPAMMDVIEGRFTDPAASRTVRTFQILLAELPDAEFQPLIPRFVRLYVPGAELSSDIAVVGIMDRIRVTRARVSGRSDVTRIVPLAEASKFQQRRYRERQTMR